ncbi:MAG: molybdenum cofactor biosynthesis protein MoaE [Gammaproteobacteria bacterium]|nr:molybdenum cofactor biosynthesis protein MoaE [Gammaproteobacteria bacterium]
MKVEIRARAFAPWEELAEHQAHLPPGSYGACAAFVGSMRDFNEGERVTAMTLEHYAGMTERQLRQLTGDAARRHGLLDALVVHRVGALQPNEPIVLVAAWSAHRAAAFAACSEIMESLKSRATFWKKESTPGGERWVEKNTPGANIE